MCVRVRERWRERENYTLSSKSLQISVRDQILHVTMFKSSLMENRIHKKKKKKCRHPIRVTGKTTTTTTTNHVVTFSASLI